MITFCKTSLSLVLLVFPLFSSRLVDAETTTERISVDASEAPRRIMHVRLVIPAQAGPMALLYPRWIPGTHGPTNPVVDLANLRFETGGKAIPWQRDSVDMYMFHCEIPPSQNSVEVQFDYLSPSKGDVRVPGNLVSTAQLAIINWNLFILYPQGIAAKHWYVTANLRLPSGWKYGTALATAASSKSEIGFAPVSLYTLVDSPVIAGSHFRAISLKSADSRKHEIDVVSDGDAALDIDPKWLADLDRLIDESGTLFRARHYTDYHFLLALSDQVATEGLEHHESSDNRIAERALSDDNLRQRYATLLPHEFIHSWNGKYRRPAGLDFDDYNHPMIDDLLWIYEGLTRYLDRLLTTRSGFWTPEVYRENISMIAADLDYRAGRSWRPLVDTARSSSIMGGGREEWSSKRRRGSDYYDEPLLIWLEADTIIRRLTSTRSLDDFCVQFFGGHSGPAEVAGYSLEDVVNAMNQIAPYDWHSFFLQKVYSIAPRAPTNGLAQSGWRLVFTDVPNKFVSTLEAEQKRVDATYSLGLRLRDDGSIADVIPGLAADLAGIAPDMRVVAINGRGWSKDVFHDMLRATKNSDESLELLIENNGFYRTYVLHYNQGERFPHLERDYDHTDLLSRIITRRTN